MSQEGGDYRRDLTDNQYVEWDPEEGMVYLGNEEGEVIKLNAAIMQKVSEWVNEHNIARHQLYYRWNHKDHIVVDGDTLCAYNVSLPREDTLNPSREDDPIALKPLPEVTEREWRFIKATHSLCSGCSESAYYENLIPRVPDGMPAFPCPECGERVTDITGYHGTGIAKHGDGTSHQFDYKIFERWRRGEDPEEIDSYPSYPP